MRYMCENHMDILDNIIKTSQVVSAMAKKTLKKANLHVKVDAEHATELIMGRTDLSQRAYTNLRTILKKSNVLVPDYKKVMDYESKIDVGEIKPIHDPVSECNCMGYQTSLKETLQSIISTPQLFSMFTFMDLEKQKELFQYLKEKDPVLYNYLDAQNQTILLRVTGDNFRAAARMPTEQTSYSILNMLKMVNTPYGQFISTLWRGSESREMITSHVLHHYNELDAAVRHGMSLEVNGKVTNFNVICFFVADLCFIKDVIGQCACTGMYGCYHCILKCNEWSNPVRKVGQQKTVASMVKNGEIAMNVLGSNPVRDSSEFKNFQHSHGGQWVIILFIMKIPSVRP